MPIQSQCYSTYNLTVLREFAPKVGFRLIAVGEKPFPAGSLVSTCVFLIQWSASPERLPRWPTVQPGKTRRSSRSCDNCCAFLAVWDSHSKCSTCRSAPLCSAVTNITCELCAHWKGETWSTYQLMLEKRLASVRRMHAKSQDKKFRHPAKAARAAFSGASVQDHRPEWSLSQSSGPACVSVSVASRSVISDR